MKKRSFFDRLSGAVPVDEYDFDDDSAHQYQQPQYSPIPQRAVAQAAPSYAPQQPQHQDDADGQLPVDVYQTDNDIIIRTFVAGVRPDDINLSISRDVVVIDGLREERDQRSDNEYIKRELFWGSFATTIHLPQEIDVDMATASAKDGLLTLVLPRLDKSRQTKLKVKAG